MKAQGVTLSWIVCSCHMTCMIHGWVLSFRSGALDGARPPKWPRSWALHGAALRSETSARQLSSAPAWSPGKIRAGITVLTALWLTEVQCDAMWDFCTVTVVWAFSRSQHRGQWRSGGPWSSGPQWHEVTRILALVLKYVLRISGVRNVQDDDFKCNYVQ